MSRLAPLPILLLSACSAFSQPTKVCLSVPQAQKLADSLAMLPLVRREATAWYQASLAYHAAADSLAQATTSYQRALLANQQAFEAQRQVLDSESVRMALWRRRARRRGLLNWLGLTVVGGVGYLLLGR